MLTPEEFDQTLRQWVKRDIFIPFIVELDDGSEILIRQPSVAFGGGSAAFIDPIEEALVDFSHDQVVGFHAVGHEVGT
jgi:hypothetical protein